MWEYGDVFKTRRADWRVESAASGTASKIESVRKRASALVDQGYAFHSPELVQQANLCSKLSADYMLLEKEHRRLEKELATACGYASEQAIKEMDRLVSHVRRQLEQCADASLLSQQMLLRTDAQHKLLLMEHLTLQTFYCETRSGCLSLLEQLEQSKLDNLYDLDLLLPPEDRYRAFSWAIVEEQERRDKEASRRAQDASR